MSDLTLPTILEQMLIDIQDSECFYWIFSNYFDIQPPTERDVTRWWQAPLFLNDDAIWNTEFEEDGMFCDVVLKNKLPAERERIKISYEQIYRITRFMKSELVSEKDCQVYGDLSKFKMPSSS
jgi:hypothetical protein